MMGEVVTAAMIAAGGSIVTAVIAARTGRKVRTLKNLNTDQHHQGRELLHQAASSLLELHHKVDSIDSKVDVLDACTSEMRSHMDDVATWQIGHDAHHMRIDKEVRELATKIRTRQRG